MKRVILILALAAIFAACEKEQPIEVYTYMAITNEVLIDELPVDVNIQISGEDGMVSTWKTDTHRVFAGKTSLFNNEVLDFSPGEYEIRVISPDEAFEEFTVPVTIIRGWNKIALQFTE